MIWRRAKQDEQKANASHPSSNGKVRRSDILNSKGLELFERLGLDCGPVRAPGRRLVHPLPNYPLDAVLAKAPDVITYVEHGVCDLGIVGKDTILEQGKRFYEVLDLGFGRCRFALAVYATQESGGEAVFTDFTYQA